MVVSGSLTVEYENADIREWIHQELEAAICEYVGRGGVVEQIRTGLSVSSTSVISVSDGKIEAIESPLKTGQIMMAAILGDQDPTETENIIRKALSGIRSRARSNIT